MSDMANKLFSLSLSASLLVRPPVTVVHATKPAGQNAI